MSKEYIRKIEDLRKDYRVAWNKMNKMRIAYKSSTEAWADVSEDMRDLEFKREKQIERLKIDIKKEKDLIEKLKTMKKKMRADLKELEKLAYKIKEQNIKLSDLRRRVKYQGF